MTSEKPRSLPPIDRVISLTSFCAATVASWSACGASPLRLWPPSAARKTLAVVAPEQARLMLVWAIPVALLASATSERSHPLA